MSLSFLEHQHVTTDKRTGGQTQLGFMFYVDTFSGTTQVGSEVIQIFTFNVKRTFLDTTLRRFLFKAHRYNFKHDMPLSLFTVYVGPTVYV